MNPPPEDNRRCLVFVATREKYGQRERQEKQIKSDVPAKSCHYGKMLRQNDKGVENVKNIDGMIRVEKSAPLPATLTKARHKQLLLNETTGVLLDSSVGMARISTTLPALCLRTLLLIRVCTHTPPGVVIADHGYGKSCAFQPLNVPPWWSSSTGNLPNIVEPHVCSSLLRQWLDTLPDETVHQA